MGLLANILRPRAQRPLVGGARRQDHVGRWVNPAGQGGPHDAAQATDWAPGEPVGRWRADELLRFNGIGRNIASAEAKACTRAGYDLTEIEPGLADELEQVVEGGKKGPGLLTSARIAEGRTWALAYGGGGVMILVDDGREPHEPIDRANIRRVNGLISFTRWDMPVVEWGGDPKEARTFNKPRIYQLNLNSGGGAGRQVRVHADRVIRIRGMELPMHLQLREQGWDGSIFDLVWAPLRDYMSSLAMVPEAIRMLSQGVLTSPYLTEALEDDEGAARYHARLRQFRQSAGLYNIATLGREEQYEEHARSMAGIKDAFDALRAGLVANAMGMPRLVLLGEPTTGLGATDRGELEIWYGSCEAQHGPIYTPAVRRVTDLVMLSHEGPTRGQLVDYTVEWRSLWQATDATKAKTELTRAQRRAADISAMVVTPQQAQQGDPSVREVYELDPKPTSKPGSPTIPEITAEGPTAEPEQESLETAVASVAELALNGAQMKGLQDIVIAVNEGGLTYEQGIGLIGSSIPSLRGNEARVLGSDPGTRLPAGPIEGLPDQQVTPDDDAALVEAAASTEPIPLDLMSPQELKDLMGIPVKTINMQMASGKLPYWGLGNHRRVSMAAVQELTTAHRRQAEGPEDTDE